MRSRFFKELCVMPLPVLYAAGVPALDDRAAGSHKNQPPAPGEDAQRNRRPKP